MGVCPLQRFRPAGPSSFDHSTLHLCIVSALFSLRVSQNSHSVSLDSFERQSRKTMGASPLLITIQINLFDFSANLWSWFWELNFEWSCWNSVVFTVVHLTSTFNIDALHCWINGVCCQVTWLKLPVLWKETQCSAPESLTLQQANQEDHTEFRPKTCSISKHYCSTLTWSSERTEIGKHEGLFQLASSIFERTKVLPPQGIDHIPMNCKFQNNFIEIQFAASESSRPSNFCDSE